MTSDSSVELRGLVSCSTGTATADDRVAHQVASWCLDYPDPGLIERLSTMASALGEQQNSEPARMLRPQRLVNAFTAPLHHLFRPYIVCRSRDQEGASASRTGRPGRGCVGTTDRDRHR